MLKITLIVIASTVVVASALVAFQAGIFDSIHFFEETKGPHNLAYKEYTGSYSAVGHRIKGVYEYLKSQKKIDTIKGGFAIFYDDPKLTPTDKLRSICGVFTDTLITLETPYKSAVYKKSYCIVGKYPLRSYFSYMTGLYKFYPALEKYARSKKATINGPVMEIIDPKNRTIIYIVSVNNTASVPVFGK